MLKRKIKNNNYYYYFGTPERAQTKIKIISSGTAAGTYDITKMIIIIIIAIAVLYACTSAFEIESYSTKKNCHARGKKIRFTRGRSRFVGGGTKEW